MGGRRIDSKFVVTHVISTRREALTIQPHTQTLEFLANEDQRRQIPRKVFPAADLQTTPNLSFFFAEIKAEIDPINPIVGGAIVLAENRLRLFRTHRMGFLARTSGLRAQQRRYEAASRNASKAGKFTALGRQWPGAIPSHSTAHRWPRLPCSPCPPTLSGLRERREPWRDRWHPSVLGG